MSYDIKETDIVRTQHSSDSRLITRAFNEANYSLRGSVASQNNTVYTIKDKFFIRSQHETNYRFITRTGNVANYSLRGGVANQNSTSYSLRVLTREQHQQDWDLTPRDKVAKKHRSIWNIGEASVITITDVPFVELNGVKIDILNCVLSQDEGGYAWLCDFTLANIKDYDKFSQDVAFVVDLQGEEFNFIVDSKSLSRNAPAQLEMQVKGISPTAIYDNDRVETLDVVFDDTDNLIFAKQAAETALGTSITWDILDWVIPPLRLGFSNTTPIRVAQTIVEAAGGILETQPDGTLKARKRFPVSTPDFDTASVDHVFTDASDNISISEGLTFARGVNSLNIRDSEEETVFDSVEFVFDDNIDSSGSASGKSTNKGKLRVYPSPFRPVNIINTGLNGVLLSPLGQESRSETESIEVFDGRATTKYPISSITSIVGATGGFTFVNNEIKAEDISDKFELIEITYNTKSINFNAELPDDGLTEQEVRVQFLVDDPAG